VERENAEVVRRFVDAYVRRNKDAFLALLDPEFEGFPPSEWPESAAVRGRDAAWDFGLELEAPWEVGAWAIIELIEAGKDRAVMGGTREVRGKSSGVEGKLEIWGVFSFRSGRIVRIEWFSDRGEALEAAGLRE
jgi:ketosteroid isomerase-like protein